MEELSILLAGAVLVIVALAHFAPKLGVAAPVLLVLVGVAASYVPGAPEMELDPHLILTVILPPLLYSAAITVPAAEFRRNIGAISSLAVLLVILSAVVTGFVLHWILPEVPLAAAIALGAVIAPPDAVAATAVGKRLGLPPRLLVVLEGEGLVNDATALVMLRSAVAATAGAVSVWGVAWDFLYAVVVAMLIGALVAWLAVKARVALKEPVLGTAISLTVPFVAFVPAEQVHASGVLAVVVAGLITGYRSTVSFTAQDRMNERINWRTLQLLLENGVFLLMGYQMAALVADVGDTTDHGVWPTIGIGLLLTALLVALRMAFMLPLVGWLRAQQRRGQDLAPRLSALQDRLAELDPEEHRLSRLRRWQRRVDRKVADLSVLERNTLGWRGAAVLGWSGMRGVVTLAAAQSLPVDTPLRSQLLLIAFTVALVTLVGQGSTLPLLIKRIGVRGTDAQAEARALANLMEEVGLVMLETVEQPELRRSNGEPYDARVVKHGEAFVKQLLQRVAHSPDDRAVLDQRRELRIAILEAGEAAIRDAGASGEYNAHTLERAQTLLDAEIIRLEAGKAR